MASYFSLVIYPTANYNPANSSVFIPKDKPFESRQNGQSPKLGIDFPLRNFSDHGQQLYYSMFFFTITLNSINGIIETGYKINPQYPSEMQVKRQ